MYPTTNDSINYNENVVEDERISFAWSDFPLVGQFIEHSPIIIEKTMIVSPPYNDAVIKATATTKQSNTATTSNHHKGVSFSSNLEIRSYEIVVGDHPYCRNLPISFGKVKGTEVVDMDLYENLSSPKRRLNELRLSYNDRVALLQKTTGLSEEELLSLELKSLFDDATPAAAPNKNNNTATLSRSPSCGLRRNSNKATLSRSPSSGLRRSNNNATFPRSPSSGLRRSRHSKRLSSSAYV